MAILFRTERRALALSSTFPIAVAWVALSVPFLWATDVTTQHNDNYRTGTNLSEPVLNTTNVNVSSFGKLFSRAVDGHIYAQPLYVSNLTLPGQGIHNVVFVCTMHNSVFAYDADSPSASTPLWQVNLGASVPISVFGSPSQEAISVEVGILSTPVIDSPSGTLYVVAQTYEGSKAVFRLHALDITTGTEKPGSPVLIQGSVAGTGTDSVGGEITFDGGMHLQRPALLLLNGTIYIAFGSHGDDPTWHGWMFGYDATSLSRIALFCTSPNSDSSAIWQSGIGPAADDAGNIFVVTGNGLLDANLGGPDYGDSILKLSTSGGLSAVDYFSPSNQQALDAADNDLGSGGPVLIVPGTSLGIGGGKDGRLFLFETNNLGQYNGTTDNVVQSWQGTIGHFFGGSVFYNSNLYVWGSTDRLKVYPFTGSEFATTPSSQSTISPSGYANTPALSISANGTTAGTAIIWATFSSGGNVHTGAPVAGELHALDASDVSKDLWNSNQLASRDSAGSWAKFNPPTVVNGKVYLATFDGALNVYGLLAPPGSPSTVTTSGGTPQSTTIGTNFAVPLAAKVQDANGSLLGGVSVTFTAPTAGATASFGASSTATVSTGPNGVATAPALTANGQLGTYVVTATVASVTTGANFSLTNVMPMTVAATGGTPQSTVVATAFGSALQATVNDGLGNPVSGVTVTFAAPGGGASATFQGSVSVAVVTNSSGIALSPAPKANGVAGPFTVIASVAGVATRVTYSLTNLPGAPASVTLRGGTLQSTLVNTAFGAALQATVKDGSGNLVTGAMVTFAAPGSGASATFQGSASIAVTTNSSGIAISPVPVANGIVGAYTVTASVVGLNGLSFSLTNSQPALSGTAAFITMDTTTHGSWKSVYGADGYNVIGDVASNPSYVTPVAAGQSSHTWAPSTSDVRALQKASIPADRIAATWFSTTQFTIDMNMTDSTVHRVAIYFLDWDSTVRRETVDVLDTGGNVLNSQTLGASYNAGVYLAWYISGHVQFRFTRTSGSNAVVAGIFFDTPANLVSLTASGGASQNTVVSTPFGSALQATVKDGMGNPVSGTTVTFTAPSSGASAAFQGSASIGVVTNSSGIAISPVPVANGAAGAYTVTASVASGAAPASFSLTNLVGAPASVTANSGTPQTAVVNTSFGSALQAAVKDAAGNPLGGVIVTFTAPGSGASATFQGLASIGVATDGSGIAISPIPLANGIVGSYAVTASLPGLTGTTYSLTNSATPPPGTATFVTMDTTTHGNWKSVYGVDGYNVIGDVASNPSYVTPVAAGQSSHTWAPSTSDVRALQKGSNPADRIAGTWFSTSQFTITMNLTDSAVHRVALYSLDWDSTARREKIDVLDGGGNVLDTQTLSTSFNGGVYLVWNVGGYVQFRITRIGGANAVASGLFFGP